MFGSVRARTAAASVLVAGAGVVAAGFAVHGLLHRSLIADTDRAALHRAEDVAALVEAGTLPARLPIPEDKDNDELLVQVTDRSGRIVSASALMVDAPLMLPGPPPPPGGRRTTSVKGLPPDPHDPFRVVAITTAAPAQGFTVYTATELELVAALAHPEQADWPDTATRLLAEDERMGRLVADLLFLAQCDDGDFSSLTAPAEIVALDAVVRDETARLGSRSTVPVEIDIDVRPGGAGVAGRPEHLARVVRNL